MKRGGNKADGPDQRELLDRLRIDRSDDNDDREGGGRWWIVLFMFVCAVGAAAVVYFFWWPKPATDATIADADSTQTATSNSSSSGRQSGATPGTSGGAPVSAGGILSASGYITARRLATVSAEITGRVSEVLVEEGMTVEAGQVLARLDPTLAKIDLGIAGANVKSAQGALAAAESDRAEAQRILVRIQGLRRGDTASIADITKAEAAARATEARYAQAQGNLAGAQQSALRAQALLDKHEIRAPFAGIVTTRDAQPGEIVSPAAAGGGFTRTGICTIVDMTSLEVEVEVNEAFISRVKPRMKARATLDAYPDWQIPASVIAIIPTANRDKATVKVRVKIEASDPRILPDMAAKVEFFDREPPPLQPPPAASAPTAPAAAQGNLP